MKTIYILIITILLSLSLNAQIENTDSSNLESQITNALNLESNSTKLFSIMVYRLDESSRGLYSSGLAEVPFKEFLSLIEQNSEEKEFELENGESMTFSQEPSLTLLEDGFTKALPIKKEDESALAYITRLSALVADQSEYDDFILVGSTGGETGIIYSRIEAINQTTTNISEVSAKIELTVFPNPSNSIVTLSGLPEGNHAVRVLDNTGKTVFETTLSDKGQLDLSSLTAGSYFISALVNESIITKSIIIE